ncbi:zinc-binding dehydrogenase [Conexibacter stalactiti]|uniref:Zinc-binding dehydrogenase n=1 Tax=Conexibacter stalactiti TaxID=1940611 RepID=A0ABU4HP06_9ACTN|nr:zinc-binding dehydrogenase [Conexibacter stalactiti]MDW5595036.1 zinc-binding dehydrogenase [Conexibacter stalactiti]MEC5035678.1 zinc-binding dehydrogenase [Conexibacter stalactiti]
MRAVVLRRFGDASALEHGELEDPLPGRGEVVVAVRAVTTAALDLRVRSGAGHRVALPHVLGQDPVGVVAALGEEAAGVAVGERVAVVAGVACGACRLCLGGAGVCARPQVVGLHRHGGQAELVAVPAGNVVPVPPQIPDGEAAAMALTYPLAWALVAETAAVRPGERVLVTSAASGVGIAAVRVAQALGATVAAAAGSDEKLERCRDALGADAVFDYTRPEWARAVRRWSGGEGVDVVVATVLGEGLLQPSLEALADLGRLVTCGAQGAGEARFDVPSFYRRRQSIAGASTPGIATARAAWAAVAAGTLLPPPIFDRFPLAEIAAAHRRIEARRSVGRVVLDVAAG